MIVKRNKPTASAIEGSIPFVKDEMGNAESKKNC
jgi:hypothetical protein